MSAADQPSIVISGSPTPEETAAVVAVLAAMSAGGSSSPPARRRSLWSSRGRNARPRLSPGPGSWMGSVLPR